MLDNNKYYKKLLSIHTEKLNKKSEQTIIKP